jgi:hypothetical protein
LNEKIERILDTIRPSLGGADIRLKDVTAGVVTLQYYKPLSNPSACHVDRTKPTKDLVIELLEDKLNRLVPGFKMIVVLGET